MDKNFYSLPVKKVIRETTDTVSVSFDVPENLKSTFSYKAGQYLTLKFQLNGKEVRRAYSMSSSPLENHLTVTVKRVKGGLVSNHLNDNIKEGASVDVMPPQGRFIAEVDANKKRSYYLLGAGSGITPLLSILKAVSEEEPLSEVFLLYGNRNEDSIIFKSELDKIAGRYQGQVKVEHILSQPKTEKSSGLSGLFKKAKISWRGLVGRIQDKQIKQFLLENPANNQEIYYYICGPGNMIQNTQQALLDQGINKDSIQVELFSSSADSSAKTVVSGDGSSKKAIIKLDGKIVELDIPEGQTILDTLLKADYDVPYSCTSGACATCIAKVTKGQVKMDACFALDDDEIADGFVLACQAHPTTPEIEISFDID